ncbi:Glycosyl transferase family 8 [Thiorhodovibrio winogradskyi]|uniref:Glycosyl transferase family 8 n=1 Tax=Thiorhodovibrio winogradskyi TaxID=77007 RepID=A0ABZ0S9G6_9GAMM|nr:putative nucleotide-diphospho-sugar transferase [Thiorhodovibrio winogradskyi]
MLPDVSACHVLAADGWGSYAQMAWVSACTFRRHHPDVPVIWVVDELTYENMKTFPSAVRDGLDLVLRVETGLKTLRDRSRFLKTTLAQHVEGRVLYLDTDTIVQRPIPELLQFTGEFAAALEFNTLPSDRFFPEELANTVYSKLGWNAPTRLYFNSGVFVVNVSPRTLELFDRWHFGWQASRRIGHSSDQASLNHAIDELGLSPTILAPGWCCSGLGDSPPPAFHIFSRPTGTQALSSCTWPSMLLIVATSTGTPMREAYAKGTHGVRPLPLTCSGDRATIGALRSRSVESCLAPDSLVRV